MSGRGAYYKAKYGGGGHGGGRGGGGCGGGRGGGRGGVKYNDNPPNNSAPGTGGGSAETLIQQLHQLDNSQYPRYHSIETVHQPSVGGGWLYANRENPAGEPLFVLSIQKTQSDPFAKPTRVRVFVPAITANFPPHLYQNSDRRRALSDRCLRAFHSACINGGMDQAANQGNRYEESMNTTFARAAIRYILTPHSIIGSFARSLVACHSPQ